MFEFFAKDLLVMFGGRVYIHEGVFAISVLSALIFGLWLGESTEKEVHRPLTMEEQKCLRESLKDGKK